MWTFFESCWEQRPTVEVTALSSPLSRTTTHHHNTHWKQKKHRHHDRHDLPASSGSNFRGKCDRRMSRNQSRWFRCGDLTFIGKINSFLILFSIILCASAGRVGGQNVRFLCYFTVLFLFRWFDTTRTDSSYPPIPFFPCPPSTHLVLAWFRTGGGMRHGRLIKGQERTIELSHIC